MKHQTATAFNRIFTALWSPVGASLEFVGDIFILLVDSIRRMLMPPLELEETIQQMAFIGVASVPIVALTSAFSGAVLSLYLARFLIQYHATQFLGATVGLSATREIGPVLAGITVAARCGSAMAAQIGTMAVTEQIEALEMLGVQPTKYLVGPRLIAGLLMLPVLTLVSIYSAAAGAYFVATASGVAQGEFLQSFQRFTSVGDLAEGLLKAPVFGVIIALVACRQGLKTKDGAIGVGRSTTSTVVISIVLVYFADFVIATLSH